LSCFTSVSISIQAQRKLDLEPLACNSANKYPFAIITKSTMAQKYYKEHRNTFERRIRLVQSCKEFYGNFLCGCNLFGRGAGLRRIVV
jgi:hypothetical protein